MLVPIAVLAAVAGVALLALGLRGRRVDDHPLCRRCGYDLTGTPADRCPECGRDLAAARSTKTGHRRRRPGLVAGGLALLLAAGATLGAWGYAAVVGFDWQRNKPQWLLRRDLTADAPAARDAAVREFVRRHEEDPETVEAASAEAILRHATARQSGAIAGNVAYDEHRLLADAAARDDVDPALADAALTAPAGLRLFIRPIVRKGDSLKGRIDVTTSGYASDRDDIAERVTFDRVSVGGVEAEPPPVLRWVAGAGTNIYFDLTPAVADLPPGEHELRIDGRLDFARPSPEQIERWFDLDDAAFDELIGSRPLVFRRTIEVLPASTPDAAFLVEAPEHAHEMRHAARLTAPFRSERWGGRWTIYHRTPDVPVRAIWRIVVRNPRTGQEFEWPGGLIEAMRRNYGYMESDSIDPDSDAAAELGRVLDDAEEIEYHLRPALDAALADDDPTPIWGGTIVIRGVPVVREPSAAWSVPTFDAAGELRPQPNRHGFNIDDHPLTRRRTPAQGGGGWLDARSP